MDRAGIIQKTAVFDLNQRLNTYPRPRITIPTLDSSVDTVPDDFDATFPDILEGKTKTVPDNPRPDKGYNSSTC